MNINFYKMTSRTADWRLSAQKPVARALLKFPHNA